MMWFLVEITTSSRRPLIAVPNDLLGVVAGGRVEERHAHVDSSAHDIHGFLEAGSVGLTQPAMAACAEAGHAYFEAGPTKTRSCPWAIVLQRSLWSV